jgi:hypothetical protein
VKLFFNPILAGIVGITEGNILDHCSLLHENVKTLIKLLFYEPLVLQTELWLKEWARRRLR